MRSVLQVGFFGLLLGMASPDEPAILKHLAKQEEQRRIEREKKRAASKYEHSVFPKQTFKDNTFGKHET